MDAICAKQLQLRYAFALLGDEARALDGAPPVMRRRMNAATPRQRAMVRKKLAR